MKKTWKKLLGILLAVVLVLPSLTSIASAIEPAPKLTAEEAVNAAWALWDEINALEESLEAQKLPEKDLVSRLYDFVASQDEVEKIVREEDDQFGFYTTGNVYNIYDRKEEGFKGGNVDGMIEALGDQIETMDITPVGSLKIGVYSPYYGYDGNMTRNYYEAAVGIQEALGDESVVFDYYGNGSQYGEFATVESFKNWSEYGVVLVDSHGTMSGGTSWICSPLMSDYDPIDVTEGRLAISGGGVWITGTFFEKYCELPNTFIYLGICEGMKSRGLCDPLVAAGAGFVAGYSESVTFYYDGLMMPTICEYLVTESPSDPSRFYTAEEACLKAKEIHGPVDTYGDAVLLWAGNNDLVVQQTPVAATGVALDPASVDLYNNNTYKFNVVTTPADANNYTLSWASSNESVATVAEDGTVTVVGEGTATITVTLNDQLESGVFTATATVNGLGNMAVSGISLDPTAIDTYVGAAPVEITAVIAPANASNQNITWTSSDENVATVDNGVVTGVGAGTATITATTEDGGFTATATVNVVTLDDALNAEGNNLSFQNDPTNPWIMDDSDGRVSAVSNIQGQSNGASTISTTVEMTAGQPMTFDWKVNSENNYDWLTFKVNGAQVDRISGTRNWATKTWTAPSDGSYTFSWTYSKDSSVNTGSDCGWVDNVDVSNEPIIPTPTPDLPGEGFVETNEIIPGEQYIIAVDYNGQTMMMSNELDTDTNIRLVGDPAQMSGNAIVGGYSDNHLWTFSSVTGSTIQSVGNGRYCEVVTHNGYAWLGLADSASYNWTWDGNGNMVTDAPHAGQWNHLSYAETASDIDHPAFDLWIYGQPDYLPIKLYKASGDVPPVTPTPTPVTPPPAGENAFEDSFENGLANWTLVDADGDGNNWMGTYNSSWSGVLPAQDGSEAAFSQSYINYVGALTPDNWMISTEFTVPTENAVLSWYHCASDPDYNEENYSVYVGHGNDPSGYTEVVYNGYPTNTVEGQYQNVTVDLSAYAGQDVQIAFRHHNVSDMYILILDNVVVSGEGDVPPVTPTPTPVTPPPAGENAFEDSFENGLANWTLIDADGDGYNWTETYNNSTWSGVFTAQDGNEVAFSQSFVNGATIFDPGTVLYPDNWMISTEFTVPAENAVLSWYHSASDVDWNEENYSVYVGHGNDPSGYTEVVYNGYPTNSAQGEYQNITVDLSAYAGQDVQIAFRHHNVSDMYILILDNVVVSGEGDVPPVTPTPTPVIPGDLDEALNVEGGTLTFANDATYPWEVRDNYAVSGNAGVQSSTSTVTTTVELAEGEALFFDWSVSSESGWDKLIFSANGTAVRNISGVVDWTQFYYIAPAAGTYTFTWSYTKDSSVNGNNDEAYLDEVYVGEAPEVPEADLYAFNSFEESWITFNSADPSMAAPVGAPGATVFAAEYVDGTVYGYTNDGRFFTTTLSNMSNLNVVGTIGEVIVDMAYNYATGTMYAIGTSDNQAGPRSLHTVDLETGALTLVGSLEDTAVAAIMTLGITTEGEAYGISFAPGNQTNDSYLHTINLETAECEAIGPTGFPINYVQTMTYDHNNDQMLWAQFYSDGMFTQTSALVAVNLETGAGTQLGSTPVGGEVGELLGMFSVPGEGPTPPPADYTIEVGTVEANQGDRVFVPVSMDNLSSGSFTIEYDADALTYITHTNPVDDTFIVVNDWTPGILQIAVVNPIANYEGECMTLEFAVAADAEGTYALDLTVNDGASIVDEITVAVAGEDIEAIDGAIEVVLEYTVTFNYMVDGEWVSESQTVTVGEAAVAPEALPQAHEITQLIFLGWDVDFSAVYSDLEVTAEYGLLGDVYTDEELNVSDALLIMRSVAGLESLSEIQELLGDVDQDGNVTIVDALYLMRLIVGAESFNG